MSDLLLKHPKINPSYQTGLSGTNVIGVGELQRQLLQSKDVIGTLKDIINTRDNEISSLRTQVTSLQMESSVEFPSIGKNQTLSSLIGKAKLNVSTPRFNDSLIPRLKSEQVTLQQAVPSLNWSSSKPRPVSTLPTPRTPALSRSPSQRPQQPLNSARPATSSQIGRMGRGAFLKIHDLPSSPPPTITAWKKQVVVDLNKDFKENSTKHINTSGNELESSNIMNQLQDLTISSILNNPANYPVPLPKEAPTSTPSKAMKRLMTIQNKRQKKLNSSASLNISKNPSKLFSKRKLMTMRPSSSKHAIGTHEFTEDADLSTSQTQRGDEIDFLPRATTTFVEAPPPVYDALRRERRKVNLLVTEIERTKRELKTSQMALKRFRSVVNSGNKAWHEGCFGEVGKIEQLVNEMARKVVNDGDVAKRVARAVDGDMDALHEHDLSTSGMEEDEELNNLLVDDTKTRQLFTKDNSRPQFSDGDHSPTRVSFNGKYDFNSHSHSESPKNVFGSSPPAANDFSPGRSSRPHTADLVASPNVSHHLRIGSSFQLGHFQPRASTAEWFEGEHSSSVGGYGGKVMTGNRRQSVFSVATASCFNSNNVNNLNPHHVALAQANMSSVLQRLSRSCQPIMQAVRLNEVVDAILTAAEKIVPEGSAATLFIFDKTLRRDCVTLCERKSNSGAPIEISIEGYIATIVRSPSQRHLSSLKILNPQFSSLSAIINPPLSKVILPYIAIPFFCADEPSTGAVGSLTNLTAHGNAAKDLAAQAAKGITHSKIVPVAILQILSRSLAASLAKTAGNAKNLFSKQQVTQSPKKMNTSFVSGSHKGDDSGSLIQTLNKHAVVVPQNEVGSGSSNNAANTVSSAAINGSDQSGLNRSDDLALRVLAKLSTGVLQMKERLLLHSFLQARSLYCVDLVTAISACDSLNKIEGLLKGMTRKFFGVHDVRVVFYDALIGRFFISPSQITNAMRQDLTLKNIVSQDQLDNAGRVGLSLPPREGLITQAVLKRAIISVQDLTADPYLSPGLDGVARKGRSTSHPSGNMLLGPFVSPRSTTKNILTLSSQRSKQCKLLHAANILMQRRRALQSGGHGSLKDFESTFMNALNETGDTRYSGGNLSGNNKNGSNTLHDQYFNRFMELTECGISKKVLQALRSAGDGVLGVIQLIGKTRVISSLSSDNTSEEELNNLASSSAGLRHVDAPFTDEDILFFNQVLKAAGTAAWNVYEAALKTVSPEDTAVSLETILINPSLIGGAQVN